MKVLITVKQAGKKKSYLSDEEYELSGDAVYLKDLIREIVIKNVAAYNKKETDFFITGFLTSEEINDKAQAGKVGFGERYNPDRQEPEKAVECAVLAFEDGIYRVLVDETEVSGLDDTIQLKENSRLVFIKLIMLAGGMW